MNDKFTIKKFVRDDGEILEIDAREIYLAVENSLLNRPEPSTTSIEFTEADGGEMLGQRYTIGEQEIAGLIVARTTDYWTLYQRLTRFFRLNHTYKIVYQKRDGGMFAVTEAWISASLQIVPEAYERYSNWSITLSTGDTLWHEYAEQDGKEVYAHTVTLPHISGGSGGELWDTVGLIADDIGEEWEEGMGGGYRAVMVNSTTMTYPVWKVVGPCTNPHLQNDTNSTTAKFEDTLKADQTLTVDFAAGTAYVNGVLMSRKLSGVVSIEPGQNVIGFDTDGGITGTSTISWNNIIS